MAWQDILISASIILMSYALVPQVLHGFKIKKGLIKIQTSAITSLAIYTMSVAFFSLKLYFSAVMDFIIGTFWLILLLQGVIYKSSSNQKDLHK